MGCHVTNIQEAGGAAKSPALIGAATAMAHSPVMPDFYIAPGTGGYRKFLSASCATAPARQGTGRCSRHAVRHSHTTLTTKAVQRTLTVARSSASLPSLPARNLALTPTFAHPCQASIKWRVGGQYCSTGLWPALLPHGAHTAVRHGLANRSWKCAVQMTLT